MNTQSKGEIFGAALFAPAPEIAAAAHADAARYAALYGRAMPDAELEILTWAVTAATERPAVATAARVVRQEAPPPAAIRSVVDPGTGAAAPTPGSGGREIPGG